MKYAVDRIEEEIAVLENIETKEKREVNCKDLPKVKEGDIVIFREDENIYEKDEEERERRMQQMREKLERLKRKKEE